MLKKLTLSLVALMLAPAAWSQISVSIGIGPPPIRVEEPPPPPEPSYIWVPGFWAPQGNHYRWISGHYDRPPYQGAAWYGPQYVQGPGGWRYREGYWAHDRGHGHAYGRYKHDREYDDHDHGNGDDHGNGHGHGHHDD